MVINALICLLRSVGLHEGRIDTRSVFDRYNIIDLEDRKAVAQRRMERISAS